MQTTVNTDTGPVGRNAIQPRLGRLNDARPWDLAKSGTTKDETLHEGKEPKTQGGNLYALYDQVILGSAYRANVQDPSKITE